MTELGPNVFQLRTKSCRKLDGTRWQVEHGPFLVDERLAEVECGNCGEKLSPMAVLVALSGHENRIAARFKQLKVECEKARFKAERQNRVRCEHCSRLTRIRK